ncbi:MAG TPA: DUF3341 domain-containing protein [Bryobacterales bacterium]|nr:DUF3341 domain-containing protein [Bryobacterales bacterium]
MSRRVVLGDFESEPDILGVTRAARARGLKIVDVYAPYAVHGLGDAMSLEPSRLPWVCFALGLLGAGFKVWFEFWTTARSWPLNVGGKPWNSLPAFVPVTFEVMVLLAGVSTVIAFLMLARLAPGKKARLSCSGTTDNRFCLVIEETDAAFEIERVRQLFREFHAVHIEERVEEVG